jgi:hypothetical protein
MMERIGFKVAGNKGFPAKPGGQLFQLCLGGDHRYSGHWQKPSINRDVQDMQMKLPPRGRHPG